MNKDTATKFYHSQKNVNIYGQLEAPKKKVVACQQPNPTAASSTNKPEKHHPRSHRLITMSTMLTTLKRITDEGRQQS